jgi:hypothetical protein
MKPEVKVTTCLLFIIQWRYCGKWRGIECYLTYSQALEQLRERIRACPPDKVKRFRLVRDYHRKETRTIHKVRVIR